MPRSHHRFKNITGQQFGRWIVLNEAKEQKRGQHTMWTCRCRCGTIRDVDGRTLRSGLSQSCGCFKLEKTIARLTKHGHAAGNQTKAYRCWCALRSRCMNPNQQSTWLKYGGRGITFCKRWESYENFLADMGEPPTPEHSIDRIDNDGNYEPGNCRWATNQEQARNRRSTHLYDYGGRSKTLGAWAAQYGIPEGVLLHRLQRNWPIETALQQPIRKRPKHGATREDVLAACP